MPRYFPVDIWSVKKYGIDKWRAELFWLVPETEFLLVQKAVDAAYANAIRKTTPELGDMLFALYSLTLHYTMFIHAVIVVERARSAGLSILHDPAMAYYDGLLNDDREIVGLSLGQLPPKPSGWQRFKAHTWASLEEIKHHGGDLVYYLGTRKRPQILAWGRPTRDRVLYAQAQNKKITIVHPRQWMPLQAAQPPTALLGSDLVVDDLVQSLQDITANYGVSLKQTHSEYLRSLTADCLREVGTYVEGIKQKVRRQDKTVILTNNIGSLLSRCFCVANRHEGNQVVGFPHGHNIGQDNTSLVVHQEFSMADVYAAPTNGSAALFMKTQDQYPLPHGRRVEIVSLNNPAWEELWKENSTKPPPSSIKTVMFIEYPLTPHRHYAVYTFWAYQLELLLRVAIFTRELGIRTVLKRHPDRLKESENLYDDYFDELISIPFEEVFDVADAYFCPHIVSTTFPFALLTNKPVIILDTMLEGVWQEVRESLRKRCRVVPSWFDANGRLMFDEDAFAEVLMRKPEEPDDEFVKKYMFSTAMKNTRADDEALG